MNTAAWPTRDPTSHDGWYWRPAKPPPLGAATIAEHRHTCPNGTVVVARSQWVATVGRTADRWWVGSYLIGTSARAEPHTTPPDFDWADKRTGRGVRAPFAA